MHRTKKQPLPALTAPAVRLLTVCAFLILAYLPFICVYAWHSGGDPYARTLVLEMLHSAAISVVLALGCGLLLDCELRAREKSGR